MMSGLLGKSAALFDHVQARLTGPRANRYGASFLAILFVGALGLIEAGRLGRLPSSWSAQLSTSHFHAISFVFTILLIFEIVDLVLSLPESVTAAAGKQFEILSLILIRQSFKELGDLSEPIRWTGGASNAVLKIFSDATGALLIFALLGLFYRIHRERHDTETTDPALQSFTAIKKLISLVLLIVLMGLAGAMILTALQSGGGLEACFHSLSFGFFQGFYTILVFADVLIVLFSLRYSRSYDFTFRYFGFTVATVMIRLALTAPRFLDAAIGVGTMLFALALLWIDTRLSRHFRHAANTPADMD